MSANERYTITFDVDPIVYEWLMAETAKRNAAAEQEPIAGITFPILPWTVDALADAMLTNEVHERIYRAAESERLQEILSQPYELPPYEPPPVPEWLQALEREV